jgi:hypothetical protein
MAKETTKKCPYCSVTIQIDATQCFSCKNKVGAPNKYGIAEKPINWVGNIMAVIACGAFLYYMYWLFFVKQ